MQPTPKMKAAAKDLLRHYQAERSDRRRAGNYEALRCTVKLDRIIITARKVPLQELGKIPGYRAKPAKRLWKKLYREVTRIYGTGSIKQLIVESGPNVGWLARYRITVIPSDKSGVLWEDLSLIFELIPAFTIVLFEIAFDFPLQSVVDPSHVRQHALFGKTWLRPGENGLHSRWGSARSAKIVRAYVKIEALLFRIELQLHSRFLRKHGINQPSDFPKLATILPRHHIYFASVDSDNLRRYLRRSALPHKTRTAILKSVAESRKSLWTTLRLLRRKWHLVNVRRLLSPLPELNGIVLSALNKWAEQWQTHGPLRAVDKTNEQLSQ